MDRTKTAMSEIIGNIALKKRLCDDVISNSLSHAYILEGPDGSGRHTIAYMTAAALACEAKDDTSKPLPCLTCPTCKKILEKKSPDIIVKGTEGKASIGVDIARFIKEDVYTLPNDLEHKFYIIEEADKMTHQAQNALLLTLEEPPSFVHFFLLCNNSASLLETIRSRAPTLRTEPVTDQQIDDYISAKDRRAAQLKLTDKREYFDIIKAASGGIGRALAMLEPKVWKPIKEQRSFVAELVLSAINKSGARVLISLLASFSSKRDILSEQLELLSIALRDLILLKKSDSPALRFYFDQDEAIELCDKTSLTFLYNFQSAVLCAIDENKQNANTRTLLMKMYLNAELI